MRKRFLLGYFPLEIPMVATMVTSRMKSLRSMLEVEETRIGGMVGIAERRVGGCESRLSPFLGRREPLSRMSGVIGGVNWVVTCP